MAGIASLKPKAQVRNASAQLLRAWLKDGHFTWLVSADILSRQVIGRIINLLGEEAEQIDVSRIPQISPDPGDDPICACAERGKADFIATLNKKDFPQSRLSARVIAPDEPLSTGRTRKR